MLKFSEFFNQWLHQNYYKNAVLVGKKGDFYTTVSVGSLFGALLAKHFLNLIDKNSIHLPISIIEIGANEGLLMKDFISALLILRPCIFKHIELFILEPHEKLQILQKNTLKDIEFKHIKTLQKNQFNNAFFFCNELFDSFTCELIDGNKMAFVNENFHLHFANADKKLIEKCEKIGLAKGEFSPFLEDFLNAIKQSAKKFIFCTFDYGVKAANSFSLRIYQNHQIYSPFEENLKNFFGKSDMTYDVNFSHLFYILKELNMELLEFKKQNLAFIEFGLEELLNQIQKENPQNYTYFLQQSKHLMFGFNDKFHFIEFKHCNY
ncbi:SAM-dependent methyltransferase [Campylobacter sp. US33a]|uniref:SAM-dependent methyltransferase n=1 Tax=Campylobacter sp. US33a TaxID=2498120 RepID=UPI0010687C6F|nr:SAM-dependent methyltransferase [Campylobacter sp. US33a]TEY02683.1 hypothetical protein ELQ16_04700 [Campylobacter sp. US33a]